MLNGWISSDGLILIQKITELLKLKKCGMKGGCGAAHLHNAAKNIHGVRDTAFCAESTIKGVPHGLGGLEKL